MFLALAFLLEFHVFYRIESLWDIYVDIVNAQILQTLRDFSTRLKRKARGNILVVE